MPELQIDEAASAEQLQSRLLATPEGLGTPSWPLLPSPRQEPFQAVTPESLPPEITVSASETLSETTAAIPRKSLETFLEPLPSETPTHDVDASLSKAAAIPERDPKQLPSEMPSEMPSGIDVDASLGETAAAIPEESVESFPSGIKPEDALEPLQKTVWETQLAREALFEQVFGKPSPDQQSNVIVAWSINQEMQGEMGVNIGSQANAVHWNATSFLERLGQTVQPELQQRLIALSAQGPFSIETLQQLNLQAEFNARELTLNIQLMPDQLRTNVVEGQQKARGLAAEPTVKPAALSGYVNTRGSLGWTWRTEEEDAAPGIQPVSLQWDGVLNYRGWVLEGRAGFQEGSDQPWQRGDLRLIHDRPSQALRFQAGEISSPITGYQRGSSLLGVSATRQFGLQPDRITRPISNYEFFLEAPSKVEVFVNGDREQVLNLPAGTQDLRDFSLGTGINDVELIITDPVGQERRLQFFEPTATQLLAPGIQQFAYSLGAPIEKEDNRRIYDFGASLLTASHRWGVTTKLTSGLYLQANTEQQMLGADGILATNWGNWDWDAALSRDPDAGVGYATKLGYELSRSGDPQRRSLRLGWEHHNSTFLGVGEDEPSSTVPFETSLSYQQKVLEHINVGLIGRYQWTDEGNAYRVALDLSRPVGGDRQLGLKLSHAQQANGETEQQVRVNMRWSMPQRRQNLNVSTESDLAGDLKRRLSWSYRDKASINALNTSLNLSDDGEELDLSHRLAWCGYRATLELTTDATGERDSLMDWSGMESQLNFGTGLVFADGRWGWSKPVSGSFALMVPHPGMGNYGAEVNPTQNRPMAVIDRWGPAVLSNLSDYRLNAVTLDAPGLPLGHSLGRLRHRLRPGYRQGTLVTVGSDATVFLRGILQGAEGAVAELQAGEVRSLDDKAWSSKTLFTNRVGKFAVEGLKPGRFEVRLTNGEQVKFTIPDEASGIYNIGELTLEDG